jgi:hypothetical protein
MMRAAAVWMGLVKFRAADVIAGGVAGEASGERAGMVGREGVVKDGRCCFSRFKRFSMERFFEASWSRDEGRRWRWRWDGEGSGGGGTEQGEITPPAFSSCASSSYLSTLVIPGTELFDCEIY